MNIGMIQNEAVAGELSANLRRIVQGARACMSNGAEFLVASAQALDGAFLGRQAQNASFMLQARAALAALAAEVRLPMLLASHAGEPHEAAKVPRPFLLQNGEVTPIENRTVISLGDGTTFFIDVSHRPTPPPPGTECDMIIHLPTARWNVYQRWTDTVCTEAQQLGCTCMLVQSIGCTPEELLGGGSAVATPRGRGVSLPQFEESERVWRGKATILAPQAKADVLKASIYRLRTLMRRHNYNGIAVDVDNENGPLLLALARLAVTHRHAAAFGNAPAVRMAGESVAIPPSAAPVIPLDKVLHKRMRASMVRTIAEGSKVLLLSPITLSDILLKRHPEPYALWGQHAPLSGLLDSDITALSKALMEKTPKFCRELVPPFVGMPFRQEHALRLLTLENMGAQQALRLSGCDELTVLRMDRLIDKDRLPLTLYSDEEGIPL